MNRRPTLARTAGILCSNQEFQRFLAHRHPTPWSQYSTLPLSERAASVIRTVCCIQSRSELDSSAEARRRYDRMIGLPYSSWRAVPTRPWTPTHPT